MHIYVDCDGVIMDTERRIMDAFESMPLAHREERIKEFIRQLDWYDWMCECGQINNAIGVLASLPPEHISILTTVQTVAEGAAKVRYFREHGLKNNIIITPEGCAKSQMVSAKGNILIDDHKENLKAWRAAAGTAIQFHLAKETGEYPIIHSLGETLEHYLAQITP